MTKQDPIADEAAAATEQAQIDALLKKGMAGDRDAAREATYRLTKAFATKRLAGNLDPTTGEET